MKRTRILQATAVAAFAALVLSACASAEDAGTGAEASSTPAAALGSEPLVIGQPTALTGYLAAYNEPLRNGVKLAVDDINAAGGIGGVTPIELVESDIQSDPAVAGTAAQELIDKGADVLVSVCDTDSQVSIAAAAQEAGILNLSPCNADPTISSDYSHYWAVGPGADAQMTASADALLTRDISSVYTLSDPGILYITLIDKYFGIAAADRGIDIVGTDTFATGSTDFSAQITKILNLNPQPEAIVTGMLTPDIATFIKQLRAAGSQIPVVGSDGTDSALTLQVGGTEVDGTTFTTFGYPAEGTATADFYEAYQAAYGAYPDGSFAALGYGAIQVLAAAAEKAGSVDTAAVEAVLGEGLTVPTAVGDIVYPGDGSNKPIAPVVVLGIENGAFELVWSGVPENVPAA